MAAGTSREQPLPHDLERRHGRKTNARRFTGYKLHAATATKTPLLTAIAISPGNEHDGHHAATLVEQQPAKRRPARVIGDTAYGNVEVREQLEQRAIGVLGALHLTGANNESTVHKDRFAIDLQTETVTWPQDTTASPSAGPLFGTWSGRRYCVRWLPPPAAASARGPQHPEPPGQRWRRRAPASDLRPSSIDEPR
jgi:hypothetical protein